jgi:replication factor C subunit 3/5
MRKILNILESTNNSYNKVNQETVYMCTGLPSFEDVKQIVNVLMTNDYEKAYNYLNDLKIQKGFSVSDLVIELVRFVRVFYKKNIKLKLNILKWFSDIDYSACIGASEKILISNIVGIFSELRNDNWKFDI